MCHRICPRARETLAILLGLFALFVAVAPAQASSAADDTTAPALAEFSLSPATINTSAAARTITLTARITDAESGSATGSGFSNSVSFRSPSGQSAGASLGSYQRISGTANDGVYRYQLVIPRYSEPGTWTVQYFSLYDAVGNNRSLTVADLTNAGHPSSFTQTGTTADTTAPALAEFSLSPATIDTSAAARTITLTARITDAESGSATGSGFSNSVSFRSPSGQSAGASLGSYQRISGTANDGVYRYQLVIPRYSEPGTWTVQYFSLYDAVGNNRSLTVADLTNAGHPSSFTQTGTTADTTAPALAEFSLSPATIDTSAAARTITLTARITDAESGSATGSGFSNSVSFRSPSGQSAGASLGSYQRISGTANDGVYRYQLVIPRYSEPGTWTVQYFSLYDAVGNNRSLTVADLTNAGHPSSFTNGTPTNGTPSPTTSPTPTPTLAPTETPTPDAPQTPADPMKVKDGQRGEATVGSSSSANTPTAKVAGNGTAKVTFGCQDADGCAGRKLTLKAKGIKLPVDVPALAAGQARSIAIKLTGRARRTVRHGGKRGVTATLAGPGFAPVKIKLIAKSRAR